MEKDSTDKLLSDGEVEAALRSFFAALYSHGSDSESSCGKQQTGRINRLDKITDKFTYRTIHFLNKNIFS